MSIDATEETFDSEQTEADEYELRWLKLEVSYKALYEDIRSEHSNVTIQKSPKCCGQKDHDEAKDKSFRYPKLEFVKFDGDPHNWLNFWGQFSNIDTDDKVDNYKKFQYLIQATEKGSKARELINSFPPSAENYKIALEHLKERFGKEELIIEVYVRDLLNLVLAQVNGTNVLSLCNLYDKLTTQIRALETLGVTSEKYAAMLYPMVESALPSDILRAFERIYVRTGNRLTQLIEFLRREVESLQRIEMARASFMNKEFTEVKDSTKFEGDKATASTFVSSETNSNNLTNKILCVFCEKSNHVSNDCPRLLKLSLDDRRSILKKKNVCAICLRSGHHPKYCRSFIKCLICKRRHNTTMCSEIENHQSKTEENNNDEVKRGVTKLAQKPASTAMSISNNNPTVTLLQTLMVKIRHADKEVIVRALIDNGSQRSYLKKDVAEKLGLFTNNEEYLSHAVFGGLETKRRQHKLYNIIVGSIDEKFNICMSVLDEAKICGLLPRLNHGELQDALNRNHIKLTDVGNEDLEISLLIGADYCGMIMLGEFIHLGEITAVKTKLGWTVQGPKACKRPTHTMISLVDLDITDLLKLESTRICDSPKDDTADEVITKFEETIKVNSEGRYKVPLPWKEGHQDLLTNRELAYKGYDNVFKEWLKLGMIEPVLDDDGEGQYLAHHAVVKDDPNATTRIRHVLEGSVMQKLCYHCVGGRDRRGFI